MAKMAESAGAAFPQTVLSFPCPNNWAHLRKFAEDKINTSPLPATDQEDWKYLDLSPVYSQAFNHATPDKSLPQALTECLAPETAHSRLFFTNGKLDSNLSDTSALRDNFIHFSLLAKSSPDVTKYFGALADPNSSDLFANINTARFEDSAVIHVPSGQSPDIPLHVVFRSIGVESGELPIVFPRILVVLEPGAKAHLVEEYRGHGAYLTASVVEVVLGEGANLRHDRVQRESTGAFHFCTLRAEIARFALYSSTLISLGAALSRHNQKINLSGEHSETELNGLSVISSTQVADTHSVIDHAMPNCTSRQLQKYIIDDSAHGVFNGQIMVRPGAQQTNANQTSRSILLSECAKIDTKPQLEIYADDVKCSHGTTVGQLDADGLFYLQSRGLDLDSARNLLLAGFAADVFNHLTLPSLRYSLPQYAEQDQKR